MSKDSGDQGSRGGSGESLLCCGCIPRASNCSITPSMASLKGDGVKPSPPGDGGMGEGPLGVTGLGLCEALEPPPRVRMEFRCGGGGGGGDSACESSAPGRYGMKMDGVGEGALEDWCTGDGTGDGALVLKKAICSGEGCLEFQESCRICICAGEGSLVSQGPVRWARGAGEASLASQEPWWFKGGVGDGALVSQDPLRFASGAGEAIRRSQEP